MGTDHDTGYLWRGRRHGLVPAVVYTGDEFYGHHPGGNDSEKTASGGRSAGGDHDGTFRVYSGFPPRLYGEIADCRSTFIRRRQRRDVRREYDFAGSISASLRKGQPGQLRIRAPGFLLLCGRRPVLGVFRAGYPAGAGVEQRVSGVDGAYGDGDWGVGGVWVEV